MPHPAFEQIIRAPNRNALLVLKRCVLSLMPRLILFGCSVIVLFFFNLYVASFEGIPLLASLSPRWVALFPLIILLDTMRIYYNDAYVFGERKLTRHQGRFALTSSYPSIKYVDIRGITVHQTFWGRVFNYGDVAIGTAAQAGEELVIEAVEDPKAVVVIVEKLREHNRPKARGGGERQQD